MQETPAIIYKIVPETLWNEARAKGVFDGAAIDLTDGFIHFPRPGRWRKQPRGIFPARPICC